MTKKTFILFFLLLGLVYPAVSLAQAPTTVSTGVTQKVSGEVAKCGVNTFKVENDCGAGVFKNMYVQCYDGYEEKQGGESSCKSSETWQGYAKDVCLKRCSTGVKPEATSAKPVPSVQSIPPAKKEIPANAPTVTNAGQVDPCSQSEQWQSKINYYEKLAGLDENSLKKEAGFSPEEVKRILSELREKYGEIKNKCSAGESQEIRAVATSQVKIMEPVNPVSPVSREEIDTYYNAKIETIATGGTSAESQTRELKELKAELGILVGNLIKSRKEIEAAELSGLVEEIKINPGEIRADNVAIPVAEKKIFVEMGDGVMSVEPTARQVMIRDQDVNVEVRNEISIKDNKLTVGGAEVKLMASEVAEKLNIVPTTVVLKEENAKAVYEIKTGEGRKLFGFIPFSLSKTITADAGDGSVIKEKLPWYSFLTTK